MLVTLLALCTPQTITPIQPEVDIQRPVERVEARDLNGDGILDMVLLLDRAPTGGPPGQLFVSLSQGSNSWAEPVGLPLDPSHIARRYTLGDIDGDGDVDVVTMAVLTSSVNDGALYAWLNRGDGTFDAPFMLIEVGVPGTLGNGLAIGDLQGDGIDDVIFAATAGANTAIEALFGPVTAGAAATPLLAIVGPATGETEVELGDFDGDGLIDIALGSSDSLTWAKGDGVGGLVLVSGDVVNVPHPVQELQAVDQNGDGELDLVASTMSSVIVFIPDPFFPGGPKIPVLEITRETCVWRGNPTGFGGPCITLVDHEGQLIDVDNDGDQDVVYTREDSFPGRLWIRESLGQGVYAAGDISQLHQSGGGRRISSITGADVDSDGAIELLVGEANATIEVVRQDPATSGLHLQRITSVLARIGGTGRASVVDVDGDGILDVAVEGVLINQVVAFRRGADGSFEPGRTAIDELRDFNASGTWIDLDADGVEDFVSNVPMGSFSPTGARVFRGDGTGGYTVGVTIAAPSGSIDLDRLYGIDMDGDGDEDLAFVDDSRSVFGWYEQNAAGELVFSGSALPGPNFSYQFPWYVFEDLNGDGLRDVVMDTSFNAPGGFIRQMTVNLADASGGFGSEQVLTTYSPGNPARRVSGLFVTDVNGDGNPDIARAAVMPGPSFDFTDSIIDAFLGDGTGGFAAPAQIMMTDTSVRAVEDLDGDGAIDVLGLSRPNALGGTSLFWFRGDGAGGFVLPERLVSDADEVINPEVFDVDGDGDKDLVVLHLDSNQIDLFEFKVLGDIGESFCDDATPNSTGQVGSLTASGSARVLDGDMTLRAESLPPGTFGLFVTGTQAISVPLLNSSGTLCVGGQIGRFVQPGEIQGADAAGAIDLDVDPRMLPTGNAFVTAAPGETRYFQLWHRDVDAGGSQSSNLTTAVRVLMR